MLSGNHKEGIKKLVPPSVDVASRNWGRREREGGNEETVDGPSEGPNTEIESQMYLRIVYHEQSLEIGICWQDTEPLHHLVPEVLERGHYGRAAEEEMVLGGRTTAVRASSEGVEGVRLSIEETNDEALERG